MRKEVPFCSHPVPSLPPFLPHVEKVCPRAGEHAHATLGRDALCQQRLSGPGRAREQHASDAADAPLAQQRGVFQVVDDLDNLLLDLVDAVDVLPGNEVGGGVVDADLGKRGGGEGFRVRGQGRVRRG